MNENDHLPVLITGLVRFGTSWTGEMISFADNTCQLFEPFHPDHPCVFGDKKIGYHFPDSNYDIHEMKSYVENLLQSKYFLFNELSCARSIKDVIRVFYRYFPLKLKCLVSKPSVLIKDPYAFFLAEWLEEEFKFKNVVLIRHPVAFVESFTRNTSWDRHSICNSLVSQQSLLNKYDLIEFESDLIKFAEMEIEIKKTKSVGFNDDMIRFERASLIWNIFAKTYTEYCNKHNWIFLKYEELASNPVESFKKVYQELGFEFTTSQQVKIQNYCSGGNKVKSDKFVDLKRDSKSLVRSWEKRMDEKNIEYIKNLTKKYGESIYMNEF